MTEPTPPNPNLITYGDVVTPESEATLASLLTPDATDDTNMTMLILSRDGSRRIVRAEGRFALANTVTYPFYLTTPLGEGRLAGRWENVLDTALTLPETGQLLILWHDASHRREAPKMREMVGLYVPYGKAIRSTELSTVPVNPIPQAMEWREQLATIAHGWDDTWHGRYVFSNHRRQQVTGRLVDGMLAHAEGLIDHMLMGANAEGDANWQALLPPIQTAVSALCDLCAGDPTTWARRMARSLDLAAFDARLRLGEIPTPITSSSPWAPGTPITRAIIPSSVKDTNARLELAARWHDRNTQIVEERSLRYYDVDMQAIPEREYGPIETHTHRD